MKKILFIVCLTLVITGCSKTTTQNNVPTKKADQIKTAEVKIKTTYDKLQGKWTSINDKKSMIEFKNNKKVDYYDNKQMTTESFVLSNSSTTAPTTKLMDGKFLITMGQFDATIYTILKITDSKLELSYLPRGNTLKYKKSR